MISRRDKLLNKPWEQRKYDNHLRKVQSAVPVIDNKPPMPRDHVSVKLKKRQREIERMRQIENDNLILLRRINYVMNTNRVDNWNIPPQQTKYLNRVPLSYPRSTSRPSTCSTIAIKEVDFAKNMDADTVLDKNQNHLRKSKCLACSPHHAILPIPIVDDSARIPWEEPKMYSKCLNRRSNSLPLIKTSLLIKSANQTKPRNDCKKIEKGKQPSLSAGGKKSSITLPTQQVNKLQQQKQRHKSLDNDCAQKLVISRGSLKLCVKFPSDSQILLKDGCKEKIVFGNHNVCTCKM